MEYENFSQLTAKVRDSATCKKVAVVAAEDEHTLEAVFKARKHNIIEPILLGNSQKISEHIHIHEESVADTAIIHVEHPVEAASLAVDMINRQEADFLMKGKIQTADLLRAVVNREKGLRTGNIMSHVAFLEIPGYPKLLAISDAGMVLHPDLDEKKHIIENAVSLMLSMGYSLPKVAVMTAVETVNPKMQETVDALRLKHMNQDDELKNCLVEGPISYDLAISKESASIKGYESPVTGDVDLMVVPTITAGNLLAKSLIYSAGGKLAGVIVGAKVPIVLASRGSSTEEKFLSLVLSASAENLIDDVNV